MSLPQRRVLHRHLDGALKSAQAVRAPELCADCWCGTVVNEKKKRKSDLSTASCVRDPYGTST